MGLLRFSGRGGAFNTKEGNNSAFIKREGHLILFDCGSSTFKSLLQEGVLEGVNKIDIFITHTHPDHVGSLGDLIFFAYYALSEQEKIVTVYAHPRTKTNKLLDLMGVTTEYYNYVPKRHLNWQLKPNNTILMVNDKSMYVLSFHVKHHRNLYSSGFLIMFDNKVVIYGGDSNELSHFEKGLIEYPIPYVDEIYKDVTMTDYPNSPHLSYTQLKEYFPIVEDRSKVYCMHLDNNFDEQLAIQEGFKVVPVFKRGDLL